MNQISTQQAQGQHTVPQQSAPLRYVHPAQSVGSYQPHYDQNIMISNVGQIPPNLPYPSLVIPQDSTVNVYHGYPNFQQMHNFQPNVPPQMYQQQYIPQHQQQQASYQPSPQQPQPAPAPKRERKILSFFDPTTNTAINLPKQEPKSDVSLSSSPQPKTESHTPVNEPTKEALIEKEDANARFTRAFVNQVVSTKIAHQNEAKHESSPVSVESPAAPEHVKEKSAEPPVIHSKEATPVLEAESKKSESPAAPPSIVLEETEPETSGGQAFVDPPPELRLDRAGLIDYYETKVNTFVAVPENMENMRHKIYNRQLLQLVRDIIKNFHTVSCPLSEEALKKIGIDRTTMPAPPSVSMNKAKFSGRDSFNPSWASSAQNNNIRRQPYVERHSANKGKNKKPPQITNRPSIQRTQVKKLVRTANAWTPDNIKNKLGDVADHTSLEIRIEKVRKEVRGLLNKVTPSTYSDLSTEIINKALWRDEDTLPIVVELIFIKAVEEPTFVGIYADLCLALHQSEQNMEGPTSKKFYSAIVRKCQNSFENTALSSGQEAIDKIENQIKEETDEKKLGELKELLEETKFNEKKKMLGTIKFISHLFRINLLNYKIIEHCILVLLKNAESLSSELMVEYSVHLIESVGPYLKKEVVKTQDVSKFEEYVKYLDKFKPKVSNRVRFKIVDLADLQAKGWVLKDAGPKTMEEIVKDAKKEEDQNKQEREVYAAQQANDPRNRNRGPIMGRPSYGGRQSSDNKAVRLQQAVAASAATGSSNVRKDVALAKIDQQGKLMAEKRSWGNKLSNSSNVSSPGPRGRNMPSRGSIDARQPSGDVRKQSTQQSERTRPQQTVVPKPDPRSASATPPPADASSSRTPNSSPNFSPKEELDKFKSEFKGILEFYRNGYNTIDEAHNKLVDLNKQLNNPIMLLHHMFWYCCEQLRLDQEDDRIAVSQLIVKSTQEPALKAVFPDAFKKYSNHLVKDDIEEDVPHLRNTFPDLVAHIMTCDHAIVSGKTLSNSEFVEGFKEFHEAGNMMFVRTLAKLVKIFNQRKESDVAAIIRMALDEFENADDHYKTDEMKRYMEKQVIEDEHHPNLKALLDSA